MNTRADTALLPELRLKRGEDRRLSAGHLWVFSNEVDTARTPLQDIEPGTICRILSDRDKFLGYAYVNPHTLICARILSRNPAHLPGKSLLVHRLQVAQSLRRSLYERPFYRLVFGESDALPGLVLDRFGDIVVGQAATAGMEALRPQIEAAVRQVIDPAAMLWKNDMGVRELEGLPAYVETAFGEVPQHIEVPEGGVDFHVSLQGGQKTGWFFDQAMNRLALRKYVGGARVLDVFSYLGAWGLGAARAGATEVTCVDSSAAALEALQETAIANAIKPTVIRGDAFQVLENLHAERRRFDVVVIDPPAFIKRRKDIPKGTAAYKRLNQLALQLLERDGILVSCSCSWHLEPDHLMGAVQRASRHLNRFTQIIEVRGQAPDHPLHPAIAESRYLKAYFCRSVQD
ncbi:23S rRNA (cytosine1962-C5)-methyltransferase [Steroidobacter denitrificans]|uniref:23S rRNA (Cytosine1962-C5)-methyltransferase n=1 Tax=Steroidobacter denitrificans TaxID=465721 RepID=A0A127F8E4_STEDE|nr:class I SAM-dependent rRNA methyltransferase [Steroidobacter denitrificans]AMN46694.1 23S rRNA (cytosine1962-C5)-methyltransferase [Steroidobacter denitrificans]